MDRLQFNIDWYHKENERHQALNEAISIPTGIVTAISVVFYFQLIEFQFNITLNPISNTFFLLLTSISLFFWVVVVYCLFKSYNDCLKGHTYKAIEFPITLNSYYNGLNEYKENLIEFNELFDSELAYENYIYDHTSTILDHNIGINDKKSFYIHLAKKWLFVCIISLLLSFIPFMYNKMKSESHPAKIEITNLNQNIMSGEPVRPTPPPPPPPREIKEDKRPTPPPTPKPSPK